MNAPLKSRKLTLADIAVIAGARDTKVHDLRTASLEAIAAALKSKKTNEQVYLIFLVR